MKIPVIGGTGLTGPADRTPRRGTSRSQGGATVIDPSVTGPKVRSTAWRTASTTLQEAEPPFTPAGAHAMTASAMVAEFNDVAGWTADAVERLGERYAIPAACRGSANPAALAWLAEACELRAGTRLLDVGAGVGGPAAWAAERFGVRPILLEPMPEACRAAARLFGLPLVLADGGRIPLQAESVDAAWCLGVLDTVRDKAAVLREIHRVLPPGAPLGLLVIVARVPEIGPTPEGNFFPTRRELAELLDGTGFDLVEQIDHPGRAPLSWTRRVERIAAAVAARHRDDRAHALATRQSESFTRLFAAGLLSVQLVHATRRPAGRPLPERVRP